MLEVSDMLGSVTGRAAMSKLLDTAAGLLSYYKNARDAATLLSTTHGQDNGATILMQLLLKVADNKLPACALRHGCACDQQDRNWQLSKLCTQAGDHYQSSLEYCSKHTSASGTAAFAQVLQVGQGLGLWDASQPVAVALLRRWPASCRARVWCSREASAASITLQINSLICCQQSWRASSHSSAVLCSMPPAQHCTQGGEGIQNTS